ncbi:hypothetical protein LINPERHAP1_LOCUS22126 [Linum perenne]
MTVKSPSGGILGNQKEKDVISQCLNQGGAAAPPPFSPQMEPSEGGPYPPQVDLTGAAKSGPKGTPKPKSKRKRKGAAGIPDVGLHPEPSAASSPCSTEHASPSPEQASSSGGGPDASRAVDPPSDGLAGLKPDSIFSHLPHRRAPSATPFPTRRRHLAVSGAN